MGSDDFRLDECRVAFVKIIKDENFYGGPSSAVSLRQHYAGKNHGFADYGLQKRYEDFKRGWIAAMKI